MLEEEIGTKYVRRANWYKICQKRKLVKNILEEQTGTKYVKRANWYKIYQKSKMVQNILDKQTGTKYVRTANWHKIYQKSKLVQNILEEQTGTESKMRIRYLKDVSSLLALVSAVREKNLDRHLQAEMEMLQYCFAFDHINYAWYLSYQQVYLKCVEANNSPATSHLKERGFGRPLSRQPFVAIHGDLVTEIFNDQTKRQAGPHASGFSILTK